MVKIKLFISFLCFIPLTCFSQVGIATQNPTADLDINGNLKIRTTKTFAASDDVSPLVIDNETNEIKVAESENRIIVNHIVYKLYKAKKDRISNFNTNIDISKYTLIVVGSSFNQLLYPEIGWYSSKNVYAFEQDGTWRLFADYLESHSKVNGDWEIYCLIINKGVVKKIPATTVNMEGKSTGAVSCPEGL
ncbi:hypothetical protein [Flavobacterium sp. CAU 1735]|uniref:hypothetical protein n=1 Tax=Flavobacterium sp. CAU 1735 TaxID=3140361 RepID=UPI0032619E3D